MLGLDNIHYSARGSQCWRGDGGYTQASYAVITVNDIRDTNDIRTTQKIMESELPRISRITRILGIPRTSGKQRI